MTKIVISDQDVAEAGPGAAGVAGRDAGDIPPAWRWGLLASAFVLPVLCIACAGALIAVRTRPAEMRAGMARYCCLLLIVSGLVTSIFAMAVWSLAGRSNPWEGSRGRMHVMERNLKGKDLCQV